MRPSRLIVWLSLALVWSAAGCLQPTPPDPNDPADNKGVKSAESLMKSLIWMSEHVNERRLKGEITDAEGRAALRRFAEGLIRNANIGEIPPEDAWKYGDIYRTAALWREAEAALQLAVDHARRAKVEDRRINDTLRLAQAKANLGKVDEAVATARSAFNAADRDAAPILPATLLEIVPAAAGRGHDVKLAELLEDAIRHHLRTIVDPESEAGKAFLSVRWRHIADSWKKAIELYQAGGRLDLARRAALRAEDMLLGHARL